MSKYIVAGGSGFIGSRLISKIGKNQCVNIDKNPSPFFNEITNIVDIRFPKQIVFNEHFSSVILLAAEHRDDVTPKSLYYDVNVDGTKNVLEKMNKSGIKHLIFTSSVAVYGLNKKNPDENHIKHPFNHYGKSKLQAEKIIKDWYDQDPVGKSVTIIRPTVVFGERNRGNVYNLLSQIVSGKFIMIGKGNNKKSMAYVGNLVSFIKNRLENKEPGFHIYNYTDEMDLDMNQLVNVIEMKMNIKIPKLRIPYLFGIIGGYIFDLFAKLTGDKFSISSVRIKKFCATTQFNSAKAHKLFKAPHSLKEGLEKTLEYEFINSNKDDILFYSE